VSTKLGERDHHLGAILLAGGTSTRLGGIDKTQLRINGLAVLDRLLDQISPLTDDVVLVGPRVPTNSPSTRFVIEDPPQSGPVSAIAAGLEEFSQVITKVLIVAGDMPGVTTHTFLRLLEPLAGGVLVDLAHQPQLCAVVHRSLLRAALDAEPHSWRQLVDAVGPTDVVGTTRETRDLDTPQDVVYWRAQEDQ
jgi:molybdopterin-guanine dinucleotide biosynthesis protein A